MLKKTTFWWWFTELLKGLTLWKVQQQPRPELSRLVMYQDLGQCPLSVFIDAICDGNLNGLVVSGKATQEQLKESWLLILSQYYDERGGIEDEGWKMDVEIKRLRNHLVLVDVCVSFLRKRWSEKIAKAINDLGYKFRPATTNPHDYIPLLSTVVNRSKTKYMLLRQLIVQLEKRMEKAGQSKPKREDFENALIEFESMQHVSYMEDKMTVRKFVQLEKRLIKKIESIELQKVKKAS